ncbi:MAG: flagellar hook-length control protein FliK [Campylobacterota bacterium]
MIVSNNSLLNILLPNDNKTLKEALKDADAKTLQDMVKKNSTSINDILKNLFNDLKTGAKTDSNIENILKNTNIFKDLGSVSKSLSTILNQIDKNSPLAKHIPVLENFLKNIKQMDEQTLKSQLLNSGVFLESKLNPSNTKNPLSTNIEKLLNQILEVTKNLNTPVSKQLNTLIEKSLSQTNSEPSKLLENLKSIVPLLENLTKSLNKSSITNLLNLTNKLNQMINDASFLESKIQNSTRQSDQTLIQKESINTQTKDLLSQVKASFLENSNQNSIKQLLSQIDSLLSKGDLFAKDTKIEPKSLLNSLITEPKIEQLSKSNEKISNLILNLKNLSENISTMESKILNFTKIDNQEKNSLLQNIKDSLGSLKTELQNIKSIDLTNIDKVVSKLENIQNLFTKIENPIDLKNLQTNNLNFNSNFSNNISNLLLNLKDAMLNLDSNNPNDTANNLKLQNQIQTLIDKVQTLPNPISIKEQPLNNSLSNDIKTVLLQMQDELSSKQNEAKSSQELLKQVDKMLTQIDYHQLLSVTSNSNYVYIPFLWDMLEDGSISMKKASEDKFYCQINLTLKDYGKVDLMLGLYDNNKIDITIQAQREHFKLKVKENISKLKQALNSVELIPVNIKLMDLKPKDDIKEEKRNIYTNSYENSDINTGLNIRI